MHKMKLVGTINKPAYDAIHYLAVEVDECEPNELLVKTLTEMLKSREHELPEKIKSALRI